MFFLTQDADLKCLHRGQVAVEPTQDLVTVAGRLVLVEPDPEGRPINRCPNTGALIKPCLVTLRVEEGYSPFVRIAGARVALDTVTGLTDGTPPGVVRYRVFAAGQDVVAQGVQS